MSLNLRFLVLALLLASALGSKDPELKKCKQQCKVQAQYDEKEAKKCVQQYCQAREEHPIVKRGGPEEKLNECTKRCEQKQDDRQECFNECWTAYEKEKEKEEREKHEGGGPGNPSGPPYEYEVCSEVCTKESPSADWKCERKCEQQPQNEEGSAKSRHSTECKQQCKVQAQFDEKEAQKCIQQYCQGREGHGVVRRGDPEKKLNECTKRCEHQQDDRKECFNECWSAFEKEKEKEKEQRQRHEAGGPGNPSDPPYEYEVCHDVCTKESLTADWKCESKCEKLPQNDKREEEGQNPYVFEDRHFFTGWKTEHGNLRILKKFTERSEKLFRGIENLRLAVMEAQPQTFLVPNYWDSDGVLFVANGKGTVSFVHQEGRESFNVKEGDIFRIEAGTTTYLINSDNDEKLVLVELVRPVNTPGEFEAFYGAGGENPESFYRAFSDEILEAAFNVRSDKLEKIFGQQKQGAIIKASKEQIRGMSGQTEGSVWPFGGESKGSSKHSLYEERSAYTNQYGQLYELDSNKFSLLKDLDVSISLANISKGAMTAPDYNSRATRITIVVGGEGYFEMACPHLSRSSGQTRADTGYRKIRSNLKVGTVVVVPAGHPFAAVASDNQNLQLLRFEINAYNNRKYTLAGKANVMKQLENEAKELAFGVAAREVDEVFNRQKEEFFLKGPQQGRRADA